MQSAFAFVLLLEGLSSALRFVTRLPVLIVYPPMTVAFAIARLVVAVQQFTAGWMVTGKRPGGPAFARWALAQSAVLVTLEIGFALAPTSLLPAHRWWAVAIYWIYALAGILAFRPRKLLG